VRAAVLVLVSPDGDTLGHGQNSGRR